MDRASFDDYVRRFNAEDASAFRLNLAPDVTVQNGALRYRGIAAMIDLVSVAAEPPSYRSIQ